MRQLLVQVPPGGGNRVIELAREHQGVSLAWWAARDGERPVEVAVVHLSNRRVESFLDDLQSLPEARVTLVPRGVAALQPPPSRAPEQVVDVQPRSPVEIFLGGLQSVGSWTGYLGYAAAGGIVAWTGLYTGTVYLLVAAMLIAPFAGPAMNAALASARGDAPLLGRSLARYGAGLGLAAAAAALLSLLLGQGDTTRLMEEVSQISAVAALLPLTAGAAGALNLVQSERSSLVSGAAVGMLVAASLSPPAGVAGMAAALGRWDLALRVLFLLALQLAGIQAAGALVFRFYGLSARGARFSRGARGVFPRVLLASLLLLGGLLALQFLTPARLQRSSSARRAEALIGREVAAAGLPAALVEAQVRFTGNPRRGGEKLLALVYVVRESGSELPAREISSRLARLLRARLAPLSGPAVPLVEVTVLDPPGPGP